MTETTSPEAGFRIRPLYFLFVAFPAAAVLHFMHFDELWVFVAACIAIVPFAGLMGRATENLAEAMGPSIGGLLNATFGNAAELIIALFALWQGKTELVKASITGSILGNILLVLGASIVAGGCFHRRQTFNRTSASLGATLLALASIGLIVPTIYYHLTKGVQNADEATETLNYLSDEIAIVLAVMYLLSLLFTLLTHRHLFAGPETEQDVHSEPPEWSKLTSLIVLLVATAGIAWMSEMLVGSVEHAGKAMGMNPVFIGVIVVAIIGNAAEHSTAILVAVKDQMDLAVTIAIGSSIQVALFVAPVLVFAALAMGVEFDLHFSVMEVIAVVVAVVVTSMVSQDGETHWMEGAMLLAVYVMLALAFYHLPPETPVAR